MARITEFVIETSIGGTREVLNQFVIIYVIACKMVHSEGLKNTLVISKSMKKSPGFAKLRSQNSEIRLSVVDDVM